jgi:hypothetical protein
VFGNHGGETEADEVLEIYLASQGE